MPDDRGSDKHGPMLDDAMRSEVDSELRSGHSSRMHEWREAEPEGDDQAPAFPRGGPQPGSSEGLTPADVEFRSQLARHLDRSTFPADRNALARGLVAHHAPDPLVQAVRGLRRGRTYRNVDEAARAILHPKG
ncbi:DUF2795 domain-containing protein [Uniformispora flossi]|uniref:DUF2795 domain-containing protein n=1 Tax=Uniformispora flossi TaxID=3390723 RepID=UPI003C2CDD8A